MASLPFGDGQSTTGSCADPSSMHFTGKERDSESGLWKKATKLAMLIWLVSTPLRGLSPCTPTRAFKTWFAK